MAAEASMHIMTVSSDQGIDDDGDLANCSETDPNCVKKLIYVQLLHPSIATTENNRNIDLVLVSGVVS